MAADPHSSDLMPTILEQLTFATNSAVRLAIGWHAAVAAVGLFYGLFGVMRLRVYWDVP